MHPVTGGTRTGRRGVAHCVVPLLPSPHQLGARAPVTDGPLIVQSDKTLLLEVDHPDAPGLPDGDRAVRGAGALPGARAHVPADPARAVERPGRRARRRGRGRRAARVLPLPGAARAARRRGRDDGPVRPAPAGQRPGARAGAARPGPDGAGSRSPRARSSPGCSAPGSTTTPSRCTRPSAAGSSRRCSSSAGRPRTWPGTSTARRTRSSCAEDGWDAAVRTSGRRCRQFWAGGSGVVVLPCGAGKTLVGAAAMAEAAGDHADPGHQHGRRPAVEARAGRPHVADRGGDRRVLAASARRSARSPSPRTRC